ncbi:MAG: acyl-CoA/acyl-ACP dehydrogenase [Deltaproteobacteria bacterium]|nr:acyl-CoA/acyl-ACP dehydrogenase [Deltaproteobacteria bacterium]MBW2419483.1 acyl-CoA/acyl-ACP dehydrogenase [Deltaproteobacteria bacterium]
MNFGFTEEQAIFRSEVRKFLDDKAPMDEVRRIMESPEGYSPKLWEEMAAMGWLGLLVPEDQGGVGLGWIDLTVLLEECGRSLYPSPLLASTLAALALRENGSAEQQERWLPGIADGSRILSVALVEANDLLGPEGVELRGEPDGAEIVLRGEKLFVPDAGIATSFVVSFRSGDGPQDVSLAVVDRADEKVEVENMPSVDATKRMGRLHLDGVRVAKDCILASGSRPGWPAAARLLDHAAAAVTAEAIGAAEGIHALVIDYAMQRVQFGSLIGRFQGVKHPLADMYVDIESFKSLLYYAAWCLDQSPEEAPLYVSMAKAYASDAFTRIGIESIELHGALGTTWEYDAQLYLRRSKWAKSVFGGSDHHYDRVADLGGL